MRKNKRTASPKIAIAYIRSSDAKQKLTPGAQRAAIEAWAAHEGVVVAAWHEDLAVCSVDDIAERPGLTNAFQSLRTFGAGLLVVAKRDRIARKPALTNAFEMLAAAQGARIVSAAGEANGDTPADQFMRHVIDGAAEYERAVMRGRTRAALAVKKARGERVGQTAYGYGLAADGVHLVAQPEELATIRRAHELAGGAKSRAPLARLGRRSSPTSYRAVARILAAEGRLSRTGRVFAASQIQRMLAVEAPVEPTAVPTAEDTLAPTAEDTLAHALA